MRLLLALAAMLCAMTGPANPSLGSMRPALWYGGDSISNAFLCPGCTVAQRLFAQAAGLRVLPSSRGLDGRTFAQFDSETSTIPEAAVIVIELGTNDFLQALPLSQVQASAADLLDRVREVNPDSALFCFGVSSPRQRTNALALRPADYDGVIQRECRRRHGSFLGIGQALEEAPGAFHPDEVHITQLGHDMLSGLLLGAFERFGQGRLDAT
jgi:GDSL-like Lipase/Acylhydrolase family